MEPHAAWIEQLSGQGGPASSAAVVAECLRNLIDGIGLRDLGAPALRSGRMSTRTSQTLKIRSAGVDEAQVHVATGRSKRGLLVTAFVAGCSSSTPSLPSMDLGALSKPAVVTARDGGSAALIGARMLWTFGDTLMTVTGADGFNYRSSTGAWGAPGQLALDDALDATGAPYQLLPYSADEAAYNTTNGPMERYALWPGSAISAPDGSGAWIFYQRLMVHPGTLNYQPVDVGLARLNAGSTVAALDPSPLFSAPTPAYALGAVVDGGFVYLYGCNSVTGQLDSVCSVVRSATSAAPTAASWQAWDGTSWNTDLTQAATVLHGPPGDLSVSFNLYLGQFIAVYSGIFSNDIWLRSAPHPEGPWSDPQKLFTALPPSSGNDYAGKEHPELTEDGGRILIVSYAHSTGTFDGEVRLSSVTLP